MRPKELIIKGIKTIFGDTRQTIVSIVVVALVGGYSGLLYLSKTALEISLLILNIKTPLWATTLLVLLCCLYTYLKVIQKPDPSSSPKNFTDQIQPIKYCECCPIGERQPLIRTGGTSKRSFYICPKTKQSYSIPFAPE